MHSIILLYTIAKNVVFLILPSLSFSSAVQILKSIILVEMGRQERDVLK